MSVPGLFDGEAEMAVIGSMVLSEFAADEVRGLLRTSDFHDPVARSLFAVMDAMRNDGKPLDFVLIKRRLGMDDAEGESAFDYLAHAAEFVAVPSNSGHYARIVGDCAWRRRTSEALRKNLDLLASGGEDSEVIRAGLKAVVEDERSGAEGVFDLASIDLDRGQQGIPSGFPTLDRATGCGWPIGQTGVVSAIHKGGKTALMVQCYRHVVNSGKRAVYCLMADLNREQLFRRVVKQECGVGGESPDLIKQSLYEETVRDVRRHYLGKGLVYDSSKSGRDVEAMESFVRAAHGKKPLDAVFVDYAQKVHTHEKGMDGTRRMEHVSDRLKCLAEDLGVALIVGSQVSQGPDGTITTKYARAIEEDAGIVVRISRESTDDPDYDPAFIDVPYNRFGPGDIRIPAQFSKTTVSFREGL